MAERDQRKRQTAPDWVGGRVNKEGNVLTRLVLDGSKMGRSLHPPTRIFSFCRDLSRVHPHIQSRRSQKHLVLSQGCILEGALSVGKMSRRYIPGTGEGVRSLQAPGSCSLVNQPTHLLNDLLQQVTCFECQHAALWPGGRPGPRSRRRLNHGPREMATVHGAHPKPACPTR